MLYRKKPIAVEAEQFFPETQPWPAGVIKNERSPTGYSIFTLENTASGFEVTPGDWIITGVKGERYACKREIFEQTYEPVTPETAGA